MEVQVPSKTVYFPLFRLAETVLQDLLPKLSDEEIFALVSNENWVAFPLPGEDTKDQIENRPDPHIDLKLTATTVRIGLRCNTVPSVEKLANILQDYHLPEKDALVESMQKLDDDFQTVVYAKIKEHNRQEKGDYETSFQRRTNQLDKKEIEAMFEESGRIRERGKNRMKDEHLPHNPVTPVIEIAFSTFDRGDDQMFVSKLSQLKPIYETCLKVKTAASIRAELRKSSPKKSKMASRRAVFTCSKCGKKFAKEEAKQRKFCDVDGMRIHADLVYN